MSSPDPTPVFQNQEQSIAWGEGVKTSLEEALKPLYKKGVGFSIEHVSLSLPELFASDGLLPLFLFVAENHANKYGSSLGLVFEEDSRALSSMVCVDARVGIDWPWVWSQVVALYFSSENLSYKLDGFWSEFQECVVSGWRGGPLPDLQRKVGSIEMPACSDPPSVDADTSSEKVITWPLFRRNETVDDWSLRSEFSSVIRLALKGLPGKPWVLPEVFGTLREEFPWALDACAVVEQHAQLACFVEQPLFSMPPLLLVGPPGGGKTRFAQRLGEIANVPVWNISGAGRSDSMLLSGLGRGWRNAQPSDLFQFVVKSQIINPMIVVDELDKVSSSRHNGNLAESMLPFLEPSSACRIPDDFLMSELDYSFLSWISIANDASEISAPLLSRFTVVPIGKPSVEHLPQLCRTIRADLAHRLRVDVERLPDYTAFDLDKIRKGLGFSFSVREVRLACERLLADRSKRLRLGLMGVPKTEAEPI